MQPQKKSVTVGVNEWVIGSENSSYVINTAGCGAIKIFVDCGKSSYFIVFHSFGTKDSREAATQIGRYILSREEKPESVRILDIYPYSISSSVKQTVAVIYKILEEKGGISVERHTVCLNNIEGEMYSRFISVDLQGTEREILDRYDHLIVKSRNLSADERAKKSLLFQSLPLNVRTPEFLRKWATLSLDEAERLVDDLTREKNLPVGFGDRLKDREGSVDSHDSSLIEKIMNKFLKVSRVLGKNIRVWDRTEKNSGEMKVNVGKTAGECCVNAEFLLCT